MNDCEELCNQTQFDAIVGLMNNAHTSNNFNDMGGETFALSPTCKCQTPAVPHFLMECGIFTETQVNNTTKLLLQ